MVKIVFLDTETTGVHPGRQVWEVGMIVRDGGKDRPKQFFVEVDLSMADLYGLRIGGFYRRHPLGRYLSGDGHKYGVPSMAMLPPLDAAREVARQTHDAIVVGAVPHFDAECLAVMLRQHQLVPAWHYHLVDVESMAAGALGLPPPWDFDLLLARYGLVYNEADRHTAGGDVSMVRDLYDAVIAKAAAEDVSLPRSAGRAG